MRKLVRYFSILTLLIITIAVAFGIFFYQFIQTPLPLPSEGVVVVIPKGASTTNIAHQLYENKVIEQPALFLLWVQYKQNWGKLKAGEYLVKAGTTPADLTEQLVEGRVIQYAFTIVEGWNFEQLMTALNAQPKFEHTLDGLSYSEIMIKLGHPGEHPEGRFFPETYFYPAGTKDTAFLKRAYNLLADKLKTAWGSRSTGLPYQSAYDALILASIIEKESSVENEYTKIAGVYTRRLLKKMPLQADPTVIYGLNKEYAGKITAEMLKKPTPYNTYQKSGLPPTPIAMPSQKSLEAACRPEPGDTLYFVAKGDKKGHIFTKTLEEHNAAVRQYRKALAESILLSPQNGELKSQGEGIKPQSRK